MRPHFEDDDEDWTMVRYNRGRRRNRPVWRDQPPASRWDSYPRRDGRRSYASVVRGYRRDDEVDFYPQRWDDRSYGWRQNSRNAPRRAPRYWTEPRTREYRGPRQRRGYANSNTSTRQNRQPQDTHSDDPDFVGKVHILHRIIKSVHHLQNVNQEKLPPSLDRITQNLATIIKPANPTRTTLTLIEGNAKYWAHNTTLILRDHYNDSIDHEVQRLSKFPVENWSAPFDVASSWAKRNLGPRLKQHTIDHAQAVIVAKLQDYTNVMPSSAAASQDAVTTIHLLDVEPLITEARLTTSTVQPAARQTSVRQPAAPRTTAFQPAVPRISGPQPADLQIPVPQPAAQQAPVLQPAVQQISTDTVRVRAEIHPPPIQSTPPQRTVGIMTEPVKSEWSPVFSVYGSSLHDPPEVAEHISPPGTPPREQRPRRDPPSHAEPLPDEEISHVRESSPQSEQDDLLLDLEEIEESPPSSPPMVDPSPPRSPPPRKAAAKLKHLSALSPPRLRSSAQTLLQLDTSEAPLPPLLPFGKQRAEATRHPNTPRKLQEWNLHIRQQNIILGDSNVHKLFSFAPDDVQIDSFPGARWNHAEFLLHTATTETEVTKMILSFGINNRSQRDRRATLQDVRRAVEAANVSFPDSQIYIPVINFSKDLPEQDKATLQLINDYITSLNQHIPPLPESQFFTESDNIHWTLDTARSMLQHWNEWVN